MKVLLWIVGIIVALILILGVGLGFYFFHIPPLPPNVITSLPPAPVPGPDDAYLNYQKMVSLFPGEPTEPELKKLLYGDLNPTAQDIPAIKILINKYKPCLDEFELGSQKDVCTIPATYLPKGPITYSLFSTYGENEFILLDWIPYRAIADTMELKGKLAELENRPEEAINDYVTLIRVGKHLDQTTLMVRMLGGILRGMGSKAMYNLLSKPNSISITSTAFKRMHALEPPTLIDLNNLALYEPSFRVKDIVNIGNAERMIIKKMYKYNINGAITQDKIINSKQELAYLSSAIRVYQSKNQKMPEKLEDLVPIPLNPLPQDPFASSPFKYFSQDTEVILYSIGPDTTDDHAQLVYDPTNGVTSKGDIVVRLIR